jgi:hypothetical protein
MHNMGISPKRFRDVIPTSEACSDNLTIPLSKIQKIVRQFVHGVV